MSVPENGSFRDSVLSSLDDGSFSAYYQPKFDPESEDIVGLEAFLRWHNPDGTVWAAGRFMPTIERSGELQTEVDSWVLTNTLRQGRDWLGDGLPFGTLSVNISSWKAGDALVDMVAAALKESQFPPRSLALECPWRMLASDTEAIASTMEKLGQLGCFPVLDGNPLDQTCLDIVALTPVKVTKVCINYITEFVDSHGVGAMKRLVKMWQRQGIQVASIGVEKESQMVLSHKIGCQFTQGNRFRTPLPPPEITYLLKAIEKTKKALSLL